MPLIPLDQIIPPADFDRLELDREALEELAKDILTNGLINPITVRPEGALYRIVAGRRRFLAHKLFTMPAIKCEILTTDQSRDIFVQVSENLHRSNLSPIEEALLLHKLAKDRELSTSSIAGLVQKSESWVRSRLDALSWPPELLDAVHERHLSMSAASPLADIDDPAERTRLIQYAVNNGATRDQTSAWLQSYRMTHLPVDPTQVIERPAIGPTEPQRFYYPCFVCEQPHEMETLQILRVCSGCAAIIRNPTINASA